MKIYQVDEDELCSLLRACCVSKDEMWTIYRDVAVDDDDELIMMMDECVVEQNIVAEVQPEVAVDRSMSDSKTL